jgi:6,7-dimethyl-8-ribityllumazine synthase
VVLPIPIPPSPFFRANSQSLHLDRVYAASLTQSALSYASPSSGPQLLSAGDLLGASASTENLQKTASEKGGVDGKAREEEGIKRPFDAIVAIGVLIKGETKHFEYISKATTEGLMRVQLDGGVPVVLGVLTVLKEEQARERAGLLDPPSGTSVETHNHGEDWGRAAVEMGGKRAAWAEGRLE